MHWNNYTSLFLCFFILGTGIELGLQVIQERYLRRRGNRIPSHLEGKVTPEALARSIEYNLTKIRFHIPLQLFEVLVTLVLIFWGFDLLDRSVRALFVSDLMIGLAFFAGTGGVTGLLQLPADLFFVFRIEEKFGFNRQTVGSFFIDLLKNTLVAAVFGGLLLTAVLLLMSKAGVLWWIPAFVAVALLQLIMLWVYPVLIMPLFNRFSPVEGSLGEAVSQMAASVGFPLKSVVSMDGSRRSAHSNAFIVGLPGARRIVLYDTLIEKLSQPQLVAVLAHELGHFRLGHIRWRLVGMLSVMAVVFVLIGLFSVDPSLQMGLGFRIPSDHGTLIASFLFIQAAAFPFGFLSRWISRKNEYAADRFAVDAVGNGEDLKDALVALTRQNLSSPGSHRLYRGYYNSHPALRERLAAISVHAERFAVTSNIRSVPDTHGGVE